MVKRQFKPFAPFQDNQEAQMRDLLTNPAPVTEQDTLPLAAFHRSPPPVLHAEILSQASLVALLSGYEAHPVAVMEALALQRPVLVADTSGLRDLAEQGLVRVMSFNSFPEEVAIACRQQIEEPFFFPSTLV